jgi:hypothetical protein
MKGRALLAALLAATAAGALAQKQTVCTVTVNSPDERDVLRRHLPAERYDFVELVEPGRSDWLESSCRRQVTCDVLIVSGHFAGTEFYSSRPHVAETLSVDALERASCSASCPGLFARLKEVYLFGCDTLNPSPVRLQTPELARSLAREGAAPEEAERLARALASRHGGSALEHMRRLFPGVPVIYGFSSKAPYGRYAGPMLDRYLASNGLGEFGTGRVNEGLRRLFAPASMVVSEGQRPDDPDAGYRAEACGYFDTRTSAAAKLAHVRATMTRSMAEARLTLDRSEKFLRGLTPAERGDPAFAAELAAFAADAPLRQRFLGLARDTDDPAVRVRLLALARSLGWLDAAAQRAEWIAMVGDLLARKATGFGEVDLICSLNQDRALDAELPRLAGVSMSGRAAEAAMACLGSPEGRSRIVSALASRDESEVQLAQAYLRHRPIEDAEELRAVAFRVARMQASGAQVRAIETLARHRIGDAAVLDELSRLSARTSSPAVRRAIDEVFLRAGRSARRE